jgi:hypothetical protein
MSTLSAISGKLAREAQRHRKFTLALINLRIQASGRVTKLGLQEKDFEESRKTLLDIVVSLREALDQELPEMDFEPLLRRMKKGKKSIEDWRKDLDAVATELQLGEPITDKAFLILDDVLELIDAEFAQDLNRLRNRYR